MSFVLILPNETFELYTDIRNLREGKTGQDFQSALRKAVRSRKWYDKGKRCQLFHSISDLKAVKDLCEIYFKDDWKVKDLREEKPKAYVRRLMYLSEKCPDEIVHLYYTALCDKGCHRIGLYPFKLISETYERAYPKRPTEKSNERSQSTPPKCPAEGPQTV